MCGIFLHLFKNEKIHSVKDPFNATIELVKKRGPDFESSRLLKLDKDFSIFMVASVLHLQGKDTVRQPYEINLNNILLWNGEIFNNLPDGENCDTVAIGEKLKSAELDKDILEIIAQIKGPYSFVFVQIDGRKIWFGRDYFGRRSLLFHRSREEFIIASTASLEDNYEWKEIPAAGIYCLELLNNSEILFKCFPWISVTDSNKLKLEVIVDNTGLIQSCEIETHSLNSQIATFNRDCDDETEIKEQLKLSDTDTNLIKYLLNEEIELSNNANRLIEVLKQAVKLRVQNIPLNNGNDTGAPVAILFSGGIDCTVLAALSSLYIPENKPIDLLNVAFENPKNPNYQVPDRITGFKSYLQLKRIFPNRVWNFVEINITKSELSNNRNKTIRNLINPLTSVLDDSIGCAVWFAARGIGELENRKFCCKSKVVICGMGADEQLAGYSRHRSAFDKSGNHNLINEVSTELERISSRNLGRDDRVISDSGREARFPFLDEDVVSYLNSLKISNKANLRYPRGIGEKILLRAAAIKLGLEDVASFPKRAIQFGSRIAKSEHNREKASDVCIRLFKNTISS